MGLISFKGLFFTGLAFLVARRVYWELTIGNHQRNFAKRHGCRLPRNVTRKDKILGLDFLWENLGAIKEYRVLPFFRQVMDDADATTVCHNVFGGTHFMTADPENIKTMLSTAFDTWSIGAWRIDQMSAYLGRGIFVNEGPAWKHSRSMLRPFFERTHVADLSLMDKHMTNFMNRIPKDGSPVNLQPLLHYLTMDIASEFLFGRSLNTLAKEDVDKDVDAFIDAFEYCANPNLNGNNWKIMLLINAFLPDPKFKKSCNIIHDFADKIIDEELELRASNLENEKHDEVVVSGIGKVEEKKERWVFLDELVLQTSDRQRMRSEVLSVLLAGRDTTATLISNVLFEIPQHPEIMSRLLSEIESSIGDSIPDYEQLKNMTYLRAILKETQRLYPIVAINSRQAFEDTTLPRGGGEDGSSPVYIPKDTPVMFHIHAMHRSKAIYGSDAHLFRPERWLDDPSDPENTLRPGWGFLPFAGGPRVCIGQNLALTEASFIIVRLLQRFSVQRVDSEEWREKLTIICANLHGCNVSLTEKGTEEEGQRTLRDLREQRERSLEGGNRCTLGG